jgi:hypothetical protein
MGRNRQIRNRAIPRNVRWTALAGAVTLAALQGQVKKTMEGLAIATFPVKAAVLSGESLPFRTVLENAGATPLQVPSVDAVSQFVYEMRSQQEGGPSYIVSAVDTNRRRSPHLPPPTPLVYQTLAPGENADRIEDLADYLDESIAPGIYFVTVHYPAGSLASPKAVATILPDNVESLSSAVSGNSLTSTMAHRHYDGGVTLLQRESLRDPREAVFYQRQSLASAGPISVATAIDVVPAGAGRWFAWLHDNSLTASVGWGDRTIVTSKPVPVDASQPELLSPGFQVAAGVGLFGVIDRKGDAVQLIAYLADRSGLKVHWTASLSSAGASSVQWNCQPNGSVTVVWQEPASGRLLSREFQPDGHASEAAPKVRTNSRPAAWAVAPAGPLAISVLAAFEGNYRYARLGAESMVRPNPIAELAGVTGWAFAPTASGVTLVAATATGISETRPGGAWQTLVETKGPQNLHLFELPSGTWWLEWVVPGYGVKRERLP